jgi:signal transduction histidine kinase
MAKAELERINRKTTIGVLAASIAHELNQPLSAIHLNASATDRLLGQAIPDIAEARAATRDLIEDSARAGKVLNGIRALIANAAPAIEDFDLRDMIRTTLALLRAEASNRRISLVFDDPNIPLPMKGSAVQIQQVVLNLILNGLDAVSASAREIRRVSVSAKIDRDQHAVIEVTDTGIGIETLNLARIFEPFYTTKERGTGIGLAICRSICEAHGGSISAFHAPGGGSTFRVVCPVRRDGALIAKAS